MSKFTQAVARAKKLYKTGRYKTFAAAVKAAYKKGKTTVTKRVGSVARKGSVNIKKVGMSKVAIRTKKTNNGYTVNLLKVGDMYLVQTFHEKRRGYNIKYSGSSKEKAEQVFDRVGGGKLGAGKSVGSGDAVVRTKPNKKNHAKAMLAKALLDYDLATTIKATKEAQTRKTKWRKVYKSLNKK